MISLNAILLLFFQDKLLSKIDEGEGDGTLVDEEEVTTLNTPSVSVRPFVLFYYLDFIDVVAAELPAYLLINLPVYIPVFPPACIRNYLQYIYLSVFLLTYLTTYLYIYRTVFLLTYLTTYLYIYLTVFLLAYLTTYLYIYLTVFLHEYLTTYLYIYLTVFLLAYLTTYLYIYLTVFLLTYLAT